MIPRRSRSEFLALYRRMIRETNNFLPNKLAATSMRTKVREGWRKYKMDFATVDSDPSEEMTAKLEQLYQKGLRQHKNLQDKTNFLNNILGRSRSTNDDSDDSD
eukprot:GEZU01017959.1.p2 GENE.GEZU01017959.1~~GEZU01017959.1.p2  ORF type:complete len:104 (+),score=9.17 GEZU01017959.1:3-314(+)